MRKCSPEHLRMGTVILKSCNEIEEEGKQKKVKIKKNRTGIKESSYALTVYMLLSTILPMVATPRSSG